MQKLFFIATICIIINTAYAVNEIVITNLNQWNIFCGELKKQGFEIDNRNFGFPTKIPKDWTSRVEEFYETSMKSIKEISYYHKKSKLWLSIYINEHIMATTPACRIKIDSFH